MSDERVTVREQQTLTTDFRRIALDAPDVAKAFKPGQFVQVRVNPDATAPLLRRPFAPAWVDADRGTVDIVYAVVGEGTRLLAAKKPGDAVGLLGPLGNGYPPPPPGTGAVLVGGGYGAPGLRPWLKALKDDGRPVAVVLGARTREGLLEPDAWERTDPDRFVTATDDGSHGFKGNAVQAVEALLDDPTFAGGLHGPVLYGCGPHPMLAGLAALAKRRGLECRVSLEERMACGFGACVGCVVEVRTAGDKTAYKKVCHDGPVFDAADIVW